MMKRKFFTFLSAFGLLCGTVAAAESSNYGIVNFSTCISDSKIGKEEQNAFENLKKQLSSHLEDIEKQMNDISAKFNDPEYMDGLSPEAEEEMKNKMRVLNEEYARYQNQFYQVLNQANMRVIQTLSSNINSAAEKVAKDKKLSMVINKDACFFYNPSLDITTLVIAEMDKTFDTEGKKQVSSLTEPAQQTTPKAETKAK